MGQETQKMGREFSNLRSCVQHTQKPHARPKNHQNQICGKKDTIFF